MSGKILAFDFFCGAGGLTRGLLDAGFQVLAGFDSDAKCRRTYEHNNPGAKFVECDVRSLSIEKLKGYAAGYDISKMLFAGCAPCQPFSQQLKGERHLRDATLLSAFGRLIASGHPSYVLMENVPGMARVKGNSTFRRFLRTLGKSGYHYTYEVVDAKYMGVPQTRKRLILIAGNQIVPDLPPYTHGKQNLPFVTVRQTISHFPPIEAGSANPDIPNHCAASITPLNMARIKSTPHDGGDRQSWPQALRLECHSGNYEGHTDVYGRMSWDAPAPTLTGRCNSISNGRYGHPSQDRAITLREAAALQTFSDDYVFLGSNKHIALQIGNAVPVRLATLLGQHIVQMERFKTLR